MDEYWYKSREKLKIDHQRFRDRLAKEIKYYRDIIYRYTLKDNPYYRNNFEITKLETLRQVASWLREERKVK